MNDPGSDLGAVRLIGAQIEKVQEREVRMQMQNASSDAGFVWSSTLNMKDVL